VNKELNSNFRCSSCGCCCPLFSTANLRFPATSVGNGNNNSSGKNQNLRVNWENGEIKRKLDWTTTKNTKTWCIPLKVWPDQHRQQWRVARLRDWEKCYEIWADSEMRASEPGDIYGGRGKGHGHLYCSQSKSVGAADEGLKVALLLQMNGRGAFADEGNWQ